jgi:hypothetical protein
MVFGQADGPMTLKRCRPLGVSIPNHPVASGTAPDKKAGRVGFVSHLVLIVRLIGNPSLLAFARIDAGGRWKRSARASRIVVFDNAINSRSCLIDHAPGPVLFILRSPATHSIAAAGNWQYLRTAGLQSGQASNFRPIPGAMRMRRKSEGNRRQGDDYDTLRLRFGQLRGQGSAGTALLARPWLMPHVVKHRSFHADYAIRERAVVVICIPVVKHCENDEQSY